MLDPARQHLGQQQAVARRSNPAGGRQPGAIGRLAPHDDPDAPGVLSHRQRNLVQALARLLRRRRYRQRRGRRSGHVAPGRIGRQDQGGDPRHGARRHDRRLGSRPDVGRSGGLAHPVRHGPGERLDVAGQRRVVFDVIAGVIADDVDHRHPGALGVVQIGEAVGEPWPGVQQRRCGLAGHPGVAVGRPGRHALEQPEHAAHLRLAVERRHEMHLGRAGIGEADVDAVDEQHIA